MYELSHCCRFHPPFKWVACKVVELRFLPPTLTQLWWHFLNGKIRWDPHGIGRTNQAPRTLVLTKQRAWISKKHIQKLDQFGFDMLSTAGLGYHSAPVSLHWTVWGSSHAPKQWAIQHLICHILIHVTTPHYNVAIPIINHPPNIEWLIIFMWLPSCKLT